MHSVILVPPARVGPSYRIRIATGERLAPLPAVEQLVESLRPVWPTVTGSAVYWNIDKEPLVSLPLRFDLVREDDLVVLAAAPSEVAG